MLRLVPENLNAAGKLWSAAISGPRKRLLSQWNGPVQGPGSLLWSTMAFEDEVSTGSARKLHSLLQNLALRVLPMLRVLCSSILAGFDSSGTRTCLEPTLLVRRTASH